MQRKEPNEKNPCKLVPKYNLEESEKKELENKIFDLSQKRKSLN